MNLIAPKFASVAKQKKIGTISARLAVLLLEKGKTMNEAWLILIVPATLALGILIGWLVCDLYKLMEEF
jgi:hypothetical protein